MSAIEEIVQGKGKFVDDISMPGMQHLAIVRSPYSRAKILSVKGGYSFADFPAYMSSVGEGATQGQTELLEPVFGKDFANYLGQPIAAVLGANRYEAEDLAEGVEVELEPLKPVIELEDALKADPIFPSMKDNILSSTEVGRDFVPKDYDVEIEDKFAIRRVATNPIETRGIVAAYKSGRLTVWTPTQSVHSIREGLCEILQMNPKDVRVIQTDTGGAFGLKGGVYPEYAIAAFLAKKTGKPVKWIESRREHLMVSRPGRGVFGSMKLYAQRSGKVVGFKGEVYIDSGAYAGGSGDFSAGWVGMQMCGAYDIKNAFVDCHAVLTNKVTQGPYRGAGRPEAHFFIERMMDKLADELHMDPLDVRLANVSGEPIQTPLSVRVPPASDFLEDAAKKLEYHKHRSENVGLSLFVLLPAMYDGESARIKIEGGKVKVWLGGNNHGQRHELFVKTLINEYLQIRPDLVSLEMGDTDSIPEGVGSWGSRTAIVGGLAIVSACEKLKKELREKFNGRYSAQMLLELGGDVFVREGRPEYNMNSLGANLVTCDVNERGQVTVKECASYYDVGRALSPEVVKSQVEGGCAQGIGQTLYEEIAYDEQGQLITASISDSGVPLANQLPEYKVLIANTRSELPHGAKGVGESPTIGVPPALTRAVEKAVGRRITETPIRQEWLLRKKENIANPEL